MLSRKSCGFAFAVIFLFSFPAQADLDAIAAFDRTMAIVNHKFYDQTFRGLPWGKMVDEHRSKLTATSDDLALKKVINELLGKLRASHTGFYNSTDQTYWALQSIFSQSITANPLCHVGAWFEKHDDAWFVRNVLEGSSAERAGLKVGDEIARVDGAEFEPVTSFQRKKAECGHPRWIEFRSGAEASFSKIRIAPRFESMQSAFLRATRSSVAMRSMGKVQIGYVHLWAGTHERFRVELYRAFDRLCKRSDALVLDLRDGFGGANPEFIEPLLSRKNGEPDACGKPLVVLINEGVRSGKEWITYILKKKQRGMLVGETTAGAFLGGSPFPIEEGKSMLYLAVTDFAPPDVTEPIEGVGVSPHEFVAYERKYAAGRDPQLVWALKRAAEMAH